MTGNKVGRHEVYQEGICRRCGWRVTVDRAGGRHIRGGKLCGPVETHNPFDVGQQVWPDRWMIPKRAA